jgi:hypothetical protein
MHQQWEAVWVDAVAHIHPPHQLLYQVCICGMAAVYVVCCCLHLRWVASNTPEDTMGLFER